MVGDPAAIHNLIQPGAREPRRTADPAPAQQRDGCAVAPPVAG
jgi:hypothetical protein